MSSNSFPSQIELTKEFFRTGDMDRAEYQTRCLLEKEENEEAYFYLGLIQNSQGKWDEALTSYYKAVSINHEYGNPCNEIGVVLLRMGKDKEAVYWLKKSVRCELNDARHISYFNLATLYKLWNRPERSLQYLYKATEIKRDFPEAWKMWDDIKADSNPSANSN